MKNKTLMSILLSLRGTSSNNTLIMLKSFKERNYQIRRLKATLSESNIEFKYIISSHMFVLSDDSKIRFGCIEDSENRFNGLELSSAIFTK